MRNIEAFRPEYKDFKKEEEKEKMEEIEKLENNSEKLKEILVLGEKYLFPDNQLPVKIVEEIEGKYEDKIPAAAHVFDKDKEGKIINESYEVNKKIDKKDYDLNRLLKISFHEIRHRVQHNSSVELFTRENLEKLSKEYPDLNLEVFIGKLPKELSPNDVDACVIERIAVFLWEKEFSLSDISEKFISENSGKAIENLKESGFLDN